MGRANSEKQQENKKKQGDVTNLYDKGDQRFCEGKRMECDGNDNCCLPPFLATR